MCCYDWTVPKLVYMRCHWLTYDPTAVDGTYQSLPNICMCLELLVPHVHVESNGTECLISFEMERSQNRVKERVGRVGVWGGVENSQHRVQSIPMKNWM